MNIIKTDFMFLTKKNGGIGAKPQPKPKNTRALGGWGDDQDDEPTYSQTIPQKK